MEGMLRQLFLTIQEKFNYSSAWWKKSCALNRPRNVWKRGSGCCQTQSEWRSARMWWVVPDLVAFVGITSLFVGKTK